MVGTLPGFYTTEKKNLQSSDFKQNPFLTTQSVVHRVAAMALPKGLIEMQTLRPYLDLLNQILHFHKHTGDLHAH